MPTAANTFPKIAYSIKEACETSSLSRTTLYKHIRNKRLRVVRVGGRTVIPADSLYALVGVPLPIMGEPGGRQ